MSEIWKSIPGYEDFYEVSNLGRVRSLHTGIGGGKRPKDRILTAFTKPGRKYRHVYLTKNKGTRKWRVHRLVALAFIGSPPDETRTTINHIDGDASNNIPENLEWASHLENMQHAHRTGLMRCGPRGPYGPRK